MPKLYIPAGARINGEKLVPKDFVDPKTGKKVTLFVPEKEKNADHTYLQR